VPKRTKNQQSGNQAEAFVGKAVADMGFIWRGRHQEDFGTDGEIELVDRTGEVSGTVAFVQVKGTRDRFPGESDEAFTYILKADHMAYWQRSNVPVLLVCVSIARQQAWWKRLDEAFEDPKVRAKRAVMFDKVADRFDPAAAPQVAAAVTPARSPLPVLSGSEVLTTNLLEVAAFAPTIYSAPTPCEERADAWALMNVKGEHESGFILWSNRVFSFSRLDTGPLAVLANGPIESFPTDDWSASEDPEVVRRFVWLLNFTLRAIHHEDLEWHQRKKVVFYRSNPELNPTKVKGKSPRSRGRTFFAVYHNDEINKVRYCRHYAADLRFRRWHDIWYLEINPTYHFTIDGTRDSLYEGEYLAGIKRLERNRAVLDLVKAWADFLTGRQDASLFRAADERITFGKLTTVDIDAAIDDKAWSVTAPRTKDGTPAMDVGA
jgi:hypothetical protein